MGKTLILAEKPSVGRDIAKVLKCNQKGKGCLIGSKYIVTWALGHLVTLAQPEVYGNKYKSWKLEDLPMLPKTMETIVIKKTAQQYSAVKNLMKRKDVDELVIATDAGREGELVARWIIEKARWKKPIKRLWISSQTDKAIRDGFNNLKPGKKYENLYKSAQCRAEADWLIGLNVTRALTCKYNAQLSAGRVQTPTLAMIVAREEEIRKFAPKDYWTIEAKAKGFKILWKDSKSNQTRIFSKEKAEAIVAKVKEQEGKVIEVKKVAKKELPPLAYDLTELQRDANRKYGYSAKKTLSIMQNLYERHKLVTYPRTDSRYITEDIVPTLPERLKSISVGPYTTLVRNVMRNKIRTTKRFVDNSKVSDHHAIIPTEQYVDMSSLTTEERHIYDLIVKRFIAVLDSPFEYEQTTITTSVNGEIFTARGRVVQSKGWKAIYDRFDNTDEEIEDDEKDQSLPEIKQGSTLKINAVKLVNGKTKPPARYTEATLLSAMEHPEKFIDNASLKKTISNTSGLGTPATRADIIEKLFNTFYVEKKGKELIPTSKGKQLVDIVPVDLKSPALTAKWEQQLLEISKGKVSAAGFTDDMKKYATKLVSTVTGSKAQYKHDNMTRTKCPECGKLLLEVKGKKGKMHVCQDRECGYRTMISQISNARCPNCHKKMEIRGSGEKKIFTCPCGHREKLSAFNERKKGQKTNLNKREVNKYLKKQDSDKPLNTSLADALAKWKDN